MIGPPGEVDPPAAVRPDSVADADGSTEIRKCLALLDMQLDIGADAGYQRATEVAAERGVRVPMQK